MSSCLYFPGSTFSSECMDTHIIDTNNRYLFYSYCQYHQINQGLSFVSEHSLDSETLHILGPTIHYCDRLSDYTPPKSSLSNSLDGFSTSVTGATAKHDVCFSFLWHFSSIKLPKLFWCQTESILYLIHCNNKYLRVVQPGSQ